MTVKSEPHRGGTSPTPSQATQAQKAKEAADKAKAAADRDRKMMAGYQFPGQYDQSKTPKDYAMDPETGLYKSVSTYSYGGQTIGDKAWGIALCDLSHGVEDAVLPCQLVWENGIWMSEIAFPDLPLNGTTVDEDFQIWLTSGNGTPGRFWFRAYKLPKKRAEENTTPKHPLLWTKKEKTGKAGTTFGKGVTANEPWHASPDKPLETFMDHLELLQKGKITGAFAASVRQTQTQAPKPATGFQSPVKVTTAPALPIGVRFRCPACGHWFKETDLKAHGTVCPGADGSGYSDWMIECDKYCGCEVIFGSPLGEKTLDHVSQCKPGFPRKKEVTAVKETTEAPTPESEPTTPEGGEGGSDTGTESGNDNAE